MTVHFAAIFRINWHQSAESTSKHWTSPESQLSCWGGNKAIKQSSPSSEVSLADGKIWAPGSTRSAQIIDCHILRPASWFLVRLQPYLCNLEQITIACSYFTKVRLPKSSWGFVFVNNSIISKHNITFLECPMSLTRKYNLLKDWALSHALMLYLLLPNSNMVVLCNAHYLVVRSLHINRANGAPVAAQHSGWPVMGRPFLLLLILAAVSQFYYIKKI